MNYNIFFPFQLWSLSLSSSKNLFRLEPPLCNPKREFSFLPHFLDSYENTHNSLRDQWKLQHTFWAINPNYDQFFLKGYDYVYIFNKTQYPYHSNKVFIDLQMLPQYSNTYFKSFILIYPSFHINGTVLGLIEYKMDNNKIRDIIFVDEQNEKSVKVEKYYNFLPFQKNKDIPFYNIKWLFNHVFFYVFQNEPDTMYWKINNSGVCVPTKDPSGFSTSFECFQNISNQRYFSDIYFSGDSKNFLTSIMNHKKPIKSNFVVPTILFFIISLILLIYIVLKHTLGKQKKT